MTTISTTLFVLMVILSIIGILAILCGIGVVCLCIAAMHSSYDDYNDQY